MFHVKRIVISYFKIRKNEKNHLEKRRNRLVLPDLKLDGLRAELPWKSEECTRYRGDLSIELQRESPAGTSVDDRVR